MRNLLFRIWYWYISSVDKNAEIIFMNFGYAHPDLHIELTEKDEKDRYPSQLYHKVSSGLNMEKKCILEIGCGRGGGLRYVKQNFQPSLAVGIDLNFKAIQFCNSYYADEKLSFLKADAQDLPFEKNSFDIVINIESSHRYDNMKKFLAEVKRVLKPGGIFSFADFRYDHEMDELEDQLKNSDMMIISKEDITENVTLALSHMSKDRKEMVRKFLPKFLHKTGYNFAGAEGTETYTHFSERKYEYVHYVIKNHR